MKLLTFCRQWLSWCSPTRRCFWCRRPIASAQAICPQCQPFLPFYEQGCLRCAEPLPLTVAACGDCQKNPPPFDHVITAFEYRAPIDRWIAAFKYQGKLVASRVLSTYLIEAIQGFYQATTLPTHILPVPLHASRLRQRGFNQANLIAKDIARALSCKLITHQCRRVRATTAQSTLKRRLRKQNCVGSFSLKLNAVPAHVAIVDDVMTTGQTVMALARALKQAGVQRIDIWCLARTAKRE